MMTANEVGSELTRKHEAEGVSNIQLATDALSVAREAATHGDYQRAWAVVRDARDRLYFAEIELRKAEMISKRSR